MFLRPDTLADLQQALSRATEHRTPVSGWDLSALASVVDYTPEDLTVTAGAGLTLGDLQDRLAVHGQWLPLDPPDARSLPLERLLALDLSGPRRLGHGTVRDWVIGIALVRADGTLIRSGGRVVKNVAGFDLAKLFIGARGSLGVIVEVTFKVSPRPSAEAELAVQVADWSSLRQIAEGVRSLPLAPVRLDAWRPTAADPIVVRVGLAGCPEAVAQAVEAAGVLGFTPAGEDPAFALPPGPPEGLGRPVSVAPTRLVEALAGEAPGPFLARLGNGLAWVPGERLPGATTSGGIRHLADRIKSRFDPHHLLPPIPT